MFLFIPGAGDRDRLKLMLEGNANSCQFLFGEAIEVTAPGVL